MTTEQIEYDKLHARLEHAVYRLQFWQSEVAALQREVDKFEETDE